MFDRLYMSDELVRKSKEELDDMLREVDLQKVHIQDALKKLSRHVKDGAIDSDDPRYSLYFSNWPADVTEYYYGNLNLDNDIPYYRTQYLSMLAFLEECVCGGAIAYHRGISGFSWIVVDEDVYAKICWEYGFSTKHFLIKKP